MPHIYKYYGSENEMNEYKEVKCELTGPTIPVLYAVQLEKNIFVHRDVYEETSMWKMSGDISLEDIFALSKLKHNLEIKQVSLMRQISSDSVLHKTNTVSLLHYMIDWVKQYTEKKYKKVYNTCTIEEKLETTIAAIHYLKDSTYIKINKKKYINNHKSMIQLYNTYTEK